MYDVDEWVEGVVMLLFDMMVHDMCQWNHVLFDHMIVSTISASLMMNRYNI